MAGENGQGSVHAIETANVRKTTKAMETAKSELNVKLREDCKSSGRPIIIVGCPRSGTLLMSRMIGGSDKHFLITEHANKEKYCPEDISRVNDAVLWWESFKYSVWDNRTNRPLVETPIYNRERIEKAKKFYLRLSKSKRLVLKNPAHLARIRFLKEMFPCALFVFCVRSPWHTLQSMVIKGNKAFLLKTFGNYVLPDDLLLRAAFSWGEAIEIYLRERDDNWIVAKYEDFVFCSKESIRALYEALFIDDEKYFEKALTFPRVREHNYYYVKKLFQESKYKSNIMRAIESGCKLFSYPSSLDQLSGHKVKYHSDVIKRKVQSIIGSGKQAVRKAKRLT